MRTNRINQWVRYDNQRQRISVLIVQTTSNRCDRRQHRRPHQQRASSSEHLVTSPAQPTTLCTACSSWRPQSSGRLLVACPTPTTPLPSPPPPSLYKTRSSGTLHTSAKARLTSVAIQIWIHMWTDRQQNLIICSMAQPSLKIYANPLRSFCAKLLTDKQTQKQTDRQTTTKNILVAGDKNRISSPTHKPLVIRAFNSEPMTFSFTSNFNPDQRTTLPWHSLKFNTLQWRHQRKKWSVHTTYVTYLTESNQNFLKNESLIATLLSQTWPFQSPMDNKKQKQPPIFFHFPTAWAPTHWMWRQRSPYCFFK